ncbi:cyclin-dependent kinase inhibitor 5-like isoform X2 [Primulina eburnea]|uniref:cyclin-dependent kinase inhibitor 5-like isoform X2 n=1 Tax=Primulina eburnea TaxID=1245227 RepID=UPI003C6CC259
MEKYYLQERFEESTGAEEEGEVLMNFIKKRKLCPELQCAYCGDVEFPENSVSSVASVACGGDDDDESSGGVEESVVSADLEDIVDLQCEGLDTEISMAINCSGIQSSTPTSEIRGDSEQSSLESTPHATSNSACSTAETMPSAVEIEKFFAAAEKYEQKRFAEKYNYDIGKDYPVEGKYEWVPLHP